MVVNKGTTGHTEVLGLAERIITTSRAKGRMGLEAGWGGGWRRTGGAVQEGPPL